MIHPVLFANPQYKGCIKIGKMLSTEETFVTGKKTMAEAKIHALRLCISITKERDCKSLALGFGIRNSYTKKRSKFSWLVTIQQVRDSLARNAAKAKLLEKKAPLRKKAA